VRTPLKVEDSTGDLIFTLAERQDRIRNFLQKKIERLDRRVTALEERGRS
jgi:chaperonin cofactor prefoldin